MNRTSRRSLGILFWCLITLSLFYAYSATTRSSGSDHRNEFAAFLFGNSTHLVASDPTKTLQKYDPVFRQTEEGVWKQSGYVTGLRSEGSSANRIGLTWYDPTLSASEFELVYYRNAGRLEDVVRIMLPAEKRLRIQQQLAAAFNAHGQEFSNAFVPLVQQSIEESLPVIEEEFRKSIARHHAEVEHLADRWNDEVVSDRLIPLARQEILPIVRQHGQPTAEAIGRDVWNRASVWRFGWRAVYDRAPLPEQNLVQEEWRRFVEQEAVPVFERHVDEIVESVQKILAETAANPKVRSELADVLKQLSNDPEAQALVKAVLKETLVDNQNVRQVWGRVWQSDEAKQAIEMAGERMEPVVRKIGDELFGSQQTGIDPMFARVLRNQIFGKDRRWLVARHRTDTASEELIQIVKATDSMVYPVVYLASETGSGSEGGRP
ncbi:hypothetical protein [Novipirellula artificiosorum]|uniref:Uncharacterized protein n=1 Tax=Novipirellula artificiosorum TaxID=2528016 RepID=A0A5C6DTR3_9BACT|nr:hypothetical protein [Novipirellula artificiosorum]TWU39277.1 hypothetical protein Poly41_21000 [Novipirellula artificiosorum]